MSYAQAVYNFVHPMKSTPSLIIPRQSTPSPQRPETTGMAAQQNACRSVAVGEIFQVNKHYRPCTRRLQQKIFHTS